MDYLQKPVNLTINQDWDLILSKFDHIYRSVLNGEFDQTSEWTPQWMATQYNFNNNMGSVVLDNVLSKNWTTWTGLLLNSQLKWSKQAKELFSNLNFHGLGLSVTTEDIALHTDGKRDDEESLPQCKILYIIKSEDKNAVTISYDAQNSNITQSFPSIPRTALLLNTDSPHEVKSSGYRAVLQFKFHTDFNSVANFLDQCGPIVFE
jgi:hypothetical protein